MAEKETSSDHGSDPTSERVSGAGVTMNLTDDQLDRSSDAAEPSKPTFSFMENRKKYRVVVNEDDVTPFDMVDPNYVTMETQFSHAAFAPKQHRKVSTDLTTRSKLAMSSRMVTGRSAGSNMGMRVYATTIDLDDIQINHAINTEEGYPPEGTDLDQAPSAYYLPKDLPLTSYPKEIAVTLKETGTVHLFSLPTFSYDRATADGTAAEEENEYYQYITVGKGRNRKMVNQETQTRQKIHQTRHSLATRPRKKNQMSFASLWDMHDTYAQLAMQEESEEEDEMVMFQCAAPHLLRKKRLKGKKKPKPTTWEAIAELPQFYDAALLCERVLAGKDYSEAQKAFRGLVSIDLLSPDLIYVYTMKPLWSFECNDTASRPIASVSFNRKNPDILAVGHGKFGYAEKVNGIVCVWCTKNPCTPERLYRFEYPVTSVSFSNQRPNWLAVAFSNGEICILDISSYVIKIIAKSSRETNPSFEPIWRTSWHAKDKAHEYVMTAGQDGRISRFTSTKTHDFICTPMMRIAAVEGKMRGLETPKSCTKVDVPITRYPAALCILWHPVINHIYYVGTDEGCVHTCSTHYLNQHMDVFKAHAGPVYNMQFSPFMPQLLVTCGADNAIRIWIDDLDAVIMTLSCCAAVYDIAFCPVNATILISVSGNVLSVWDLRRKTHMPCTEYTFPGNVILSYVKFSPSGDNLFVADTMGRIHTFHLEDTPIPPYYQREMLDDAIKKALCTRPLLLLQLEKREKFRDKHK